MRILVTGAAGFVGGYLLRLLGEKKHDRLSLHLIATARRVELEPELARWADGYFPADLSENCPPVTAGICIHAAGLADDRSTVPDLYRANVVATRKVIEALQDCRLFVYISSASVYGLKDAPLRELDATAETPRSDYGRSKWAAEQTVREVCEQRGIAYVIVRPRAIYGVGDRVLMPRLMRLMRPPLLLIIGKGDAPISLTYIGNLAEVITAVVFAQSPPKNTVLNVADAAVYRLRPVLAALYAAIHQIEPRIVCIPVGLINTYLTINEALGRKGALSQQSLGYLTESCVLDCTRARDALHYAPFTTFFDHAGAIGQAVKDGQRSKRGLRTSR